MRFINKLRQFFYGRYGIDSLYYLLFFSAVFLWLVRLFITDTIVAIILYIIELLLFGFAVFRVFSRNIYARRAENEKFLGFFRKIRKFFVLQKDRIKYFGKYRYRTCPHCKSTLRLPKNSGKHTVKCPKCSERFEVHIII